MYNYFNLTAIIEQIQFSLLFILSQLNYTITSNNDTVFTVCVVVWMLVFLIIRATMQILWTTLRFLLANVIIYATFSEKAVKP